jgi:hypothetical protein
MNTLFTNHSSGFDAAAPGGRGWPDVTAGRERQIGLGYMIEVAAWCGVGVFMSVAVIKLLDAALDAIH